MKFNVKNLNKEEIQEHLINFALEQINNKINDPKAREEVMKAAQKISLDIFHQWQVWAKQVNLHTKEEAISIALETCIRKDPENQKKVAAFVIALYSQYDQDIKRAAQVGGSLLKRFGRSYFPRIKDRELKFALPVDSELEEYLYQQLSTEDENCKNI